MASQAQARVWKRSEGPFATRVPCNPEKSVGLQAALTEPASAFLHVAEPVRIRTSARRITLAVITGLCSNGYTCNKPYCNTSAPFCSDDDPLLCKFCYRRMNNRIIYMCMSMGFCTEECREEYFLDCRYRLTMALEAEGSRITRSDQASKAMRPATEGEAVGHRRIFFTCAEAEVESSSFEFL